MKITQITQNSLHFQWTIIRFDVRISVNVGYMFQDKSGFCEVKKPLFCLFDCQHKDFTRRLINMIVEDVLISIRIFNPSAEGSSI